MFLNSKFLPAFIRSN